MADRSVSAGAGKRCRSPSSYSLGWAEYDADLLDNVRKTKRFAVDVSMASDLASKMTMGGISPGKSVNRNATSGADAMCISSVECSPAATPLTTAVETAPAPAAAAMAGWATPQRPVVLCPSGSAIAADRSLTSPSDPQIDTQDLRRVALRRVALLRGASAVEGVGSPMVLGGDSIIEGDREPANEPSSTPVGDGNAAKASPAVSRRPSRLARPPATRQQESSCHRQKEQRMLRHSSRRDSG